MATALALPGTEQQVVPEFQFTGHLGQGLALYKGRTHAAQLTLPGLRKAPEKCFGNDMIEDGVPQELQAFVVAAADAAMCERQAEKL